MSDHDAAAALLNGVEPKEAIAQRLVLKKATDAQRKAVLEQTASIWAGSLSDSE